MSEPASTAGVLRRAMFRISLRTWLVVIAIVTCLVAWQSRRSSLTPANVSSLSVVASLDEDIREIAWSPERDRMALLGWEKPAVVRDVLSLKTIETIGEGQKLIHFAFSPDKGVVAYCRNGKTAEILDRRTGRASHSRCRQSPAANGLQPGRQYAGNRGIWNDLLSLARLGRETPTPVRRGADEGRPDAVFSPDGTMLAVGNRNAETHIFDVATGKVLHVLDPVQTQGLQFSPTGGPWRWPTSMVACASGTRRTDGYSTNTKPRRRNSTASNGRPTGGSSPRPG